MADAPSIGYRKDGPYIAKNVETLLGEDGSPLETKEAMPLCRCGLSSNKPFCDGSHREEGWSDEGGGAPSGADRLRAYEGGAITVLYNPRICSHAAVCVSTLPKVFDPGRKPWIEPDHAAAEEVRAACRDCPSGALQVRGEGHAFPERPQVTVQKDGPLWVEGPGLESEGAQVPGEGGTPGKYVLCRCGLSGNKPFCDGSHHDADWSSGA